MYQLKSEIDKKMNGELYNSIKNSEISKIQRSLLKENGFETFLPYVSSSSQGAGGSGQNEATTPENIFDGSAVTEASFSLVADSDWKLLVVDYISNSSSFGAFTVSGDYYVGLLFGSVLTNGVNTLNNSSFNSLNKTGISSDGIIYKNNVHARQSHILLNEGTLAINTTANPVAHLKIGIKSTRMRIISLSGTPNKIFYAVRNGTMNFTKLPTSGVFTTIQVGTQIDVDSSDFTTGYGFGYGGNYHYGINMELSLSLTLNTNPVQWYYGISHSNDTLYQSFPGITLTGVPGTSNYVVVGSSSGAVNHGSSSALVNLIIESPYDQIYFFNNTFTSGPSTSYKVFAVGRGINNFFSRYVSSTSGGGLNPFIFASGTLLSFTVQNINNFGYAIDRIGQNIFDGNVSGIAYNPRRFTLYKSYGTVTAHRFPRILSVTAGHKYFFEVTLNDSSTSSLWCGILNVNTAYSAIESNGTLPYPEIYMKIDSGLVGTISDPTFFTFPNTYLNTGIYHVFLGVTLSGTTSFLEIGRNVLQVSTVGIANMSHYSIVFWSNGGTSDTSQPMMTLHRITNTGAYS
jgi:hypothetical protein